LRRVGVLIFVHHHVPETLAIFLQNFGLTFQHLHGFHYNVVKVHGVGVGQPLLIKRVHVRHVVLPKIARAGLLKPRRGHQLVFLPANQIRHMARRILLVAQI
jgi:hypothetical protein